MQGNLHEGEIPDPVAGFVLPAHYWLVMGIMARFFMYEVWGGFIYNLTFAAFSVWLGWEIAKYIGSARQWEKRYTRLLATMFAVVIFIILRVHAI